MTTRPPIIAEQLVYSWAMSTIAGAGFGIVGHSAGWRPQHRSAEIVARLSRFLPQGAVSADGDGSDLPISLAFFTDDPDADLLVRRRYLGRDSVGRPGRFLAHALRVPKGVIGPAEALAVLESNLMLDDWPIESPANPDMPPVRITAIRRSPRTVAMPVSLAGDPHVAAVVDVFLGTQQRSRGSLIVGIPSREVSHVLRAALGAVPAGIVSGVGFSTYERSTKGAPEVAFADERLTDTMRLEKFDRVDADEGAVGLAEDLVAWRASGGDPVPDSLTSVPSVQVWLRARQVSDSPIASLSDDDLGVLMASDQANGWLRRRGSAQRVASWVWESGAGVPDGLESSHIKRIAEVLLRRWEESVRRIAPDRDTIRDICMEWAGPTEVAGRARAVLVDLLGSGSLAALHISAFGDEVDDILAQLSETELERIADGPSAFDLVARWTPLSAHVVRRGWRDPAWVPAHESLVLATIRANPDASISCLDPVSDDELRRFFAWSPEVTEEYLPLMVRSGQVQFTHVLWVIVAQINVDARQEEWVRYAVTEMRTEWLNSHI